MKYVLKVKLKKIIVEGVKEREDSKISSQLRLYNLVMGDVINQDGEMGGPDLERENQVLFQT